MRRDHHTNKPTRHRSLTNPPPTTGALQTRYVTARASQVPIDDNGHHQHASARQPGRQRQGEPYKHNRPDDNEHSRRPCPPQSTTMASADLPSCSFTVLIASPLMTCLTHRHHPLQVQASIRSEGAHHGNKIPWHCGSGTRENPLQATGKRRSFFSVGL
jgi:hypothetical protein